MSILSKAYFHDEAAAFAYLEELIWAGTPVCPKCGNTPENGKAIYELKGVRSKPSKKNPEGVERHGLKKCGACRKQFTVRVGTVFESSHVPLHKWLQAAYLMMSSKKGISSKQLERTLEVTYKTAWFMSHRLREAMRQGELDVPFGSGGGAVEVDETFIGREPGMPKKRAYHHKMKVLSLLDRDTGRAKSIVVDNVRASTLVPILRANIAREARVMTDEASQYLHLGNDFASHDYVRHGKGEYVSYANPEIHTNTVEGYYSVFKRGMQGVYQHCGKKHLHRYMAEFDFRYNNRERLGVNDMERTAAALRGIVGKRLTYQGPSFQKA